MHPAVAGLFHLQADGLIHRNCGECLRPPGRVQIDCTIAYTGTFFASGCPFLSFTMKHARLSSIVQGSGKAVLRHVSDLPRFGRRCGPPSCERRAPLHWFELSRRKIFDRRPRRRSSGNRPAILNFDKKVRHGLNAVHGFDAAEFDPSCPRQLAIVPENPKHGFGVVRRMCGSKSCSPLPIHRPRPVSVWITALGSLLSAHKSGSILRTLHQFRQLDQVAASPREVALSARLMKARSAKL